MMAIRRPGDVIAGGVLVSVAAVIWWQSTTWPAAADVAGNPVVFPRVLAGVMALVALVLVLRPRPAPEEAAEDAEARPFNTMLAVGATLALALLLEPLGLIVSGIAYVLVLQRLVGAPWRVALPFAIATPIVIWLTFATALHVPLPAGAIWTGLLP